MRGTSAWRMTASWRTMGSPAAGGRGVQAPRTVAGRILRPRLITLPLYLITLPLYMVVVPRRDGGPFLTARFVPRTALPLAARCPSCALFLDSEPCARGRP